MALATTSRGARSASSCTPCMKRLPSKSTRNAPSPRTASEISGCWPRESGTRYITVGWNCTNSRSRSNAPARRARAHAVALALAQHVEGDPGDPAALLDRAVEKQVDRQRVLDDLDLRRPLDG